MKMRKKILNMSLREQGSIIYKLFLPRILVFGFLILLSLTTLAVNTFGQVACFDQCQQQLASCLQLAQSNPLLEASCQDRYDDCIEGCLINSLFKQK
jgi:hypothetical protein